MKSLSTTSTFLFLLLSVLSQHCVAFTPNAKPTTGTVKDSSSIKCEERNSCNRHDFVKSILVASSAGIASSGVLLVPNQPSYARGRATLEFALDRYYPRIEAGGVFYASDLKKAIERNDWNAIKVRTVL